MRPGPSESAPPWIHGTDKISPGANPKSEFVDGRFEVITVTSVDILNSL